MKKTNIFKVGDQIRFTYKGKSHSGTVEKINRKTIIIKGEIGRFRAHPKRLSHNDSPAPSEAKSKPKKTRRRKWSEAQKSDYHVSNKSTITPVPEDRSLEILQIALVLVS